MRMIRSKEIAWLRRCTRIALSSLLLAGAACSGWVNGREEPSISDPDPLLVGAGAELFATRCASCHGLDARGDGPAASAFGTPLADLTRIAARNGGVFPESSIARKIDGRFDLPAHGSREMPIWGARLPDEIPGLANGDEVARGQIASLVEYLKSLQRK
jgi:mono/diheme cytochrome c family protein